MDPNTALDNILRGYEVVEHAMALNGWLMHGGFAPDEKPVPEPCALFVADHCRRCYSEIARTSIHVRANTVGLWTKCPGGQWRSLALWSELAAMKNADQQAPHQ